MEVERCGGGRKELNIQQNVKEIQEGLVVWTVLSSELLAVPLARSDSKLGAESAEPRTDQGDRTSGHQD